MRTGLVSSAHDVSEGGLAVALAECCIAGGIGARVEVSDLFGEGPGGVVVSAPLASIDKLGEMAAESGFLRLGEVGGERGLLRALERSDQRVGRVPALGAVGGDRLVTTGPAATLSVPVVDLATAFETGIPAKFSE